MNTSLSEATSFSAMPASSASRGLCPNGSARLNQPSEETIWARRAVYSLLLLTMTWAGR
jgi:hypothetical protein